MSKLNFESLEATINAIREDETRSPNMPVDTYLQEAEDLVEWCKTDQDRLTSVGIPKKLFAELPVRIGALRYAQSVWNKDRFTRDEAAQEWDEKSPVAYDLKNELEHSFRYAFRNRPDLLNKIHQIELGSGNADMLQDLSDLSVLGRENDELLSAINFDQAKLDTAATTADEMAKLLATVNGEREEGNISRLTRDKAFTFLKGAVDEVREAGKYVFWKESEKGRGYTSRYFRNR